MTIIGRPEPVIMSLSVSLIDFNTAVSFSVHTSYTNPGLDLAGGTAGAQLKLGLTKTMINNARQLSRSLVGIYR